MGSARLIWLLWTACLMVAPGFMYEWIGPVVPGPSDVLSLALPLAAVIILDFVTRNASRVLANRKAIRTLQCVGTAALASYVATRIVDCCYVTSVGLSLELRTTAFLVRLPSEILAVTCWSLLSLGLSPKEGEASIRRVPMLFFSSALLPFIILVANVLFSGDSFSVVLFATGFDTFDAPSVLIGASLGMVATLGMFRLSRTGFGAEEVSALLCGTAAFRAWAEVVRRLPFDYMGAHPTLCLLLLVAYVLLVLVLTRVIELGRAHGARADKGAGASSADLESVKLSFLPGFELLSERERAVLEETLSGLTGEQIAAKCGISESTVATHRKRGYAKLCVSGLGELKERLASCAGTDEALTVERRPCTEASNDLRPRWRAVVVIPMLLLMVAAPPGYVSLSEPPYGLSFERLAPFLAGLVLMSVGLSLWCRVYREGPDRVRAFTGEGGRDGRVRRFVLGVSSLGAGAMLGSAWLLPIPSEFNPSVVLELLVLRLWSALGLAALVFGAGEFFAPAPSPCGIAERVRAIACGGVDALVLRVPQCIALFGAGFLLINADLKLTSLDMLYIFYELCTWVCRIFSLLLAVLVLMSETRYRSYARQESKDKELQDWFSAKGLSHMQVQVVMLSLAGHSCSEIGAKLHLAPGTVRSYRSRACKLLGVSAIDELRKVVPYGEK